MKQIYKNLINYARCKQTVINNLKWIGDKSCGIELTAVSSQLTGFATTVSALQESVTSIQSSLNDLPDNSEAITEIGNNVTELAEELEEAQTAIASLTAQLENVSSDEDLAQISSTLANIQEDVRELLEENSTINQNITINNEATLQYAETLVGTETDDPNVIVNGMVTVEITATNFDAAQIERVNAVIASHDLRRSFATNFYGKIPTAIFMNMTGHSRETTFMQYIAIDEKRDSFADAFMERMSQMEL